MDTLFMNIMNCVTMNLDLIQGAFLTLKERVLHRLEKFPNKHVNIGQVNVFLYIEMKRICQHLQKIYE